MKPAVRLLIADDMVRSREGLRALLETCPSLDVIGEAGNGLEALEMVERYRPELVLMDARMPVMDGLEATRRIKDRWPGTRVVVLTMYGGFRDDALLAGADGFLVKGGSPDAMLRLLAS